MYESESKDSLYLTLISETSHLPLILEHVAEFARKEGVWDSDGLLLVVRELLMNAILHGNKSNSTKTAILRVARKGDCFEVQVDDEGEGFDFESLVLGLPENPQALTQRGLVLVHELSEELVFERGGCRVKAIVGPDGKRSDWSNEDLMSRHMDSCDRGEKGLGTREAFSMLASGDSMPNP
jgi:anti-sigma regulatory factor (Ser/Thr protein kinase)